MLIPENALRAVDNRLIRLLGLGYLRLTRDVLIHERLRFLVIILGALGRCKLRVLDVGCGSGMALCGIVLLWYGSRLRHETGASVLFSQ